MIRYVLLGVIQGLTEFLPVSSSGHLALAQRFLSFDPPGVVLEAVLHLGTLAAILIVFRRDWIGLVISLGPHGDRATRTMWIRLVIASVPIAVCGYFVRSQVETAFESPVIVGLGFLVTSAFLLGAAHTSARANRDTVSPVRALLIGIAQAAALVPGISRSGATVATGVLTGVRGREAARFSFLLAIPALLGAGGFCVLETLRSPEPQSAAWGALLVATLTATAVGVLAVRWFLRAISRERLRVFAAYCALLGLVTLIHTAIVGSG